ncbi:hypothetical protein Fcan01_14163 [Folsomia candida]|uniref:Uncharacterized protein n=1 Tax=Folsomia candida TaxID=158441 RepID=A0A226E1I8_FOLCA|nr:hypothetical protein Fcan01_14163 [Folsomia candida]
MGLSRVIPTPLCQTNIDPGKYGSDAELRSRVKSKQHDLANLRFLDAPKAYRGPHNVAWDPHVRRGSSIVHFTRLEKSCPVSNKKNRRPRNKGLTGSELKSNPMYAVKGNVIYPDVILGTKQELTDFSQFLEEQDERDEGPITTLIGQVQTEDSIRLSTEEKDELGSVVTFGSSKILVEQRSQFRQNFQTGRDVQTQADYFHISTDMRHPINPIQQTIRRVSSVASKQLLSQSLLEEMEASELDQIRAQADAIEFWISQETAKKAKERRDLCKKLERMKLEAQFQDEEEDSFEDLRKRVSAGIMAATLSKSVVAEGFAQLETAGVLGAEKEAAGIVAWANDVVTQIVIKNKGIARDLKSDHQRSNMDYVPRSEVSDETAFLVKKGNFGRRDDQEVDDDGRAGDETTEYESTYDHINSDLEEDDSFLDNENSSLVVMLEPREESVQSKGDKEKHDPSIINLLGPKF